MNVEIKPTCLNCNRLLRKRGLVCEVYPHGIPEDVWSHFKNPNYSPCDNFEFKPLLTKYNWFRAVGIGFIILLCILAIKYDSEFPPYLIVTTLIAVILWESSIYNLKKECAEYVSSWRFCNLLWHREQAKIKRLSNEKSTYVHSGPTSKTSDNFVYLGIGFILGNPEKAPDILLEGYWPDISLDEKKGIILRLWQDPGSMMLILKSLQDKYAISQKPSNKTEAESETKFSFVASTEEWLRDFTLLMPMKLVCAIEEWIRNHPSEGEDLLDAVRSLLNTPDDAFLPYWASLSYATKSTIWDDWLDDPDKTANILTKLKAGGY